jgi:hypothetical protein
VSAASARDGRIRRCLEEAEHGQLGALNELLRDPSPAPPGNGWSLAANAAGASWGLPASEPAEALLEAAVAGTAAERLGAARACVYLERLALLRFDGQRLERLAALHARLADHEEGPEGIVAARLAALWADVMLWRPGDVEIRGRELHARAARAQSAAAVVEATLVRALGALAAGDPEAAVGHARRGSRMSRAEGLVAEEWTAHLVLARLRRLTGKPHLAGHILESLARVVCPAWRAWLCWELTLAAGADAAAPLAAALRSDGDRDPAARAALGLDDLVGTARRGEREGFSEARARLAPALGGFAALDAEASAVASALDPALPAPAALAAWRDGATDLVPLGLSGLPPWPYDPVAATRVDHALAFVAVEPGSRGRRVLRPGVALLPGGPEAEAAYAARRAGHRTDVGLAVLALAGPEGMATPDFFRAVWGFAFLPALHQGTLDVAAFSMRKQIEEHGEVVRGGGRIALRVDHPLVLPDPRCARSTAEHVLRLLARHGVLRAMAAAELLSVSTRTVQNALKQLVLDGFCRTEREGREIRYRVVDTTFSEIGRSGEVGQRQERACAWSSREGSPPRRPGG